MNVLKEPGTVLLSVKVQGQDTASNMFYFKHHGEFELEYWQSARTQKEEKEAYTWIICKVGTA